MADLPYLRWWVADALASTAHMDAAEVGAYRLLLDHQWLTKGGRLPADPRQLQRLARVYDPDEWKRVWGTIQEKFEEDGDGLYNARLEEERKRALCRRQSYAERGRKGAAVRHGGSSSAIAQLKPGFSSAAQRASDSDSDVDGGDEAEEERAGEGAPTGTDRDRHLARTIELPASLDHPDFRAVLRDWMIWRRVENGKAVSNLALTRTIAKLTPLGATRAIQALAQSVENDWRGVFPDRLPAKRAVGGEDLRSADAIRYAQGRSVY